MSGDRFTIRNWLVTSASVSRVDGAVTWLPYVKIIGFSAPLVELPLASDKRAAALGAVDIRADARPQVKLKRDPRVPA
jgi:hypothetical protein